MNNPQEKKITPDLNTSNYSCIFTVSDRVGRDFIYSFNRVQRKGKLILGLLTTVLGIAGITRAANAEDSPFIVDSSLFMAHGSSVEDFTPAFSVEQSHQLFAQEPLAPEQKPEQKAQLELNQSPDEVRILTPQTGVSDKSTTNLVVEYNRDAQIQISVNQQPLEPSTTTTQEIDEDRNLVTQVWYNIPLEVGENTITVQAGNGTPVSVDLRVEKISTKQIQIYPSGNPRIPADGRSTITLEGDITDENGQLITEDAVVTLTTSAGEFVGADYDEEQGGFQVLASSGKFSVKLQSGLEAKKVRIRAAVEEIGQLDAEDEEEFFPTPYALGGDTSSLEAYTQIEFITNLRTSIVSGVVNLRLGQGGTDFWGSRQDFLDPDEIDDGTELDLGTAIFATGKIGEWLFTGAYNSDRPLNQTCDGTVALFRGPQECEKQYSVYGDSSTVDYLTPSTDNVYLRFERTSPTPGAEADYVMWGDYRTNEFARASQLFTATSRALHGFKGNYSFGNLQLTALYSNDLEGFQRDTIAPNGTSGYYFLSRRLIVDGSESVYIETEDSNRPGTVLERQRLRRGVDYQIEYDRGSLLFTEPVLATEFNFFDTDRDDLDIQAGAANYLPTDGALLVRRIVVTYQFEDSSGNDTNLFGGRAQYNFSQELDSESWIGATYLQGDEGIQDFELYGADFLVRLGENSTLIGEYANSSLDSAFRGDISGSAYRFEVNSSISSGLSARAYYRSVDEDFFNNATASFTPGQTRYGGSAIARLGQSTNFRVGYDFEENFGIASAVRSDPFDLFNPGLEAEPGNRVNNTLSTIRAGVQQKIGDAVLGLDFVNRDREDRIDDTFQGDATQLVSSFGIPLAKSLLFRAQNELNLGDDDDALYPNRTTLGLDWGVYRGVRLQLSHQFFDGGLFDDDSITRLDTIVSHKLGGNTDLTGRYSVIGGFNGMTGQGAVGLNHRWAISPGLRLNLGYEHTFSNSSIVTAAGERFEQPFTPGQTAASLSLLGGDVYTVGMEYSDNPDFKASARLQHRSGSGNNNTLITASAAGKVSSALTALVRYEQANFANQRIEGLEDTINLRVGLAYRNPANDRWNALLRYEYRKNPYSIPESSRGSDTDQHLFGAEAIFAPNWRWELYGKGALRYSETRASNVDNSSTVFLSQLRATYRLAYRIDLAVEGRWIGQSDPNFNETGIAVEAGYYLTPDLRLALGYSFGSVDDDDFNGYRDEGGVYFGVSFKVNELFDGFGRQRVAPPQQQESLVKPIAGRGEGETPREGDAQRGREEENLLINFLPSALCPQPSDFRPSPQAEAFCPLPSIFLETVESATPDAPKLSTSTSTNQL